MAILEAAVVGVDRDATANVPDQPDRLFEADVQILCHRPGQRVGTVRQHPADLADRRRMQLPRGNLCDVADRVVPCLRREHRAGTRRQATARRPGQHGLGRLGWCVRQRITDFRGNPFPRFARDQLSTQDQWVAHGARPAERAIRFGRKKRHLRGQLDAELSADVEDLVLPQVDERPSEVCRLGVPQSPAIGAGAAADVSFRFQNDDILAARNERPCSLQTCRSGPDHDRAHTLTNFSLHSAAFTRTG
jgi:hypothetical protein